MTNSHNSGYFPGGVGLVNATGDLVTISPASALVNGVLTLPTTSSGTTTTTTSTAPSPLTGFYNIDSFSGAQNNVTGNMNIYDDAAASNMWSKILSDARSCTNVASGFNCMIVFGCHQYNWQNPVNFIVPQGMPTEVHITVNWNSSVHYTFGNAGICFSPYTMNGRYDDLFSRKTFYNRYQGNSAYAVKKTATAGVSAAAFSALGNTHETAGGGTSNFRFGQMDVFDANSGGHYMSWLDCSGLFFAQIDGPAGTSDYGGQNTSYSICLAGVSCIRLGGFNIQVWIRNMLPNQIECGLRIVGYVEAMLTQNLGGVNVDYNVWTDVANTDWTVFYPNDNAFGLQWTFDDQSEMDSFKWNFDITRCNIILFYGGTIYQHSTGGNPCDGQTTGDTANTGGIILRGCTEIKVQDIHFRGPAINPAPAAGGTCVNGGRGLTITSSTYTGLSGKPRGPSEGNYQRSTHGTVDNNDFAGFGNFGKVSPVLFDSDCIALSSSMNRYFFAPSDTQEGGGDGYAARYPVEDRWGSNQGFDFVGAADMSFSTSLRSLR